MALLIKNQNVGRTSGPSTGAGQSVLHQRIHVNRPLLALPQTTTEILFRVRGGRVFVWNLIGKVTTVFQGTDPVLKVSSKALDVAGAAVGTAVDVASTVDTSSLEVGGMLFVEGDGTAIVKSNAGAAFAGTNTGFWVAPQGEIYLTAGASKTGAATWDIWYQPLDEGAYVDAISVATVAI